MSNIRGPISLKQEKTRYEEECNNHQKDNKVNSYRSQLICQQFIKSAL